jgi:hypothetical protein
LGFGWKYCNNTHSYTQSHIEARTNLSSWSGGYFGYRGGN